MVIDSVEVQPGAVSVETSRPSPCKIEFLGEESIAVNHDSLIGYDPCCGLCLLYTPGGQALTALLTFAAGHWLLHDLNGNSLICNGKRVGLSLVLSDGDRVRLYDKELLFHLDKTADTERKENGDFVVPTGSSVSNPARFDDNRAPAVKRKMPTADIVYPPRVNTCAAEDEQDLFSLESEAEKLSAEESAIIKELLDEQGKTLDQNQMVGEADESNRMSEVSKEEREMTTLSRREIDVLHQRAKELCRQLLLVLREPNREFHPQGALGRGLRNWLNLFRQPRNPAQTLDRLQFLLSGSPRDRVWLFELSRFLFQQSYHGLCLQVLKELHHLYPHDIILAQTLAKFYFLQGRNTQLPPMKRLDALQSADRWTHFIRRLTPNDPSLLELEQAVSVEQTLLRNTLAGMI